MFTPNMVLIAEFTHPLLENPGILQRFAAVMSGDTLSQKKPHPLPLLHAAETLGVKPEDAFYQAPETPIE